MDLAQRCPLKPAKPFLARAAEFDERQPVVAYYLRMHAVNALMAAPRTPELKTFLLQLLDAVEADKKRLKAELEATDGRLAVTKTALMLFTLADDMERATATASEKALKLFFTASLLFEATAQFNAGKMDPMAEEKCKYSRVVAGLMKKSLETGAPYVSPNGGAESAALENLPFVPDGAGSPPPFAAPAPPPHFAAPAPPPQQWAAHTDAPPASYHNFAPPAPPPQQTPAPVTQQPQPQPRPPATASMQPAASAGPPISPKDGKAKADRVIASEKHARQAIAALQFFDEHTARAQLKAALAALGDE